VPTTEEALLEAKEKLETQDARLKQLTETPIGVGTVVSRNEHEGKPTLLVASKDGLTELVAVAGAHPGEQVKLNLETGQIIAPSPSDAHGPIVVVTKTCGDLIEIEGEGSTHMIHRGSIEPEKGERVVLDFTGTVAIANLGRDEERFRFDSTSGVCWDDIGGLKAAKQQMIDAIELPHRHPEFYEVYGKKPVAGVLLYGPAGCGKTMLGKATSSALGSIFGSDHGGFFYIKGPEILNMYVGNSEATIRQIFERTRRFKNEHGHPAVVFIDEADAVLGRRGSGISSDMEKTIVPMFLTEMDGLESSGALVILATNRQDTLDPAIVREGRIDRHIRISRPDEGATKDIFELYLRKAPCIEGDLATLGATSVFDPRKAFGRIQGKKGPELFTLAHILHGGMIENIVDQATSLAITREMNEGGVRGLIASDVTEAINHVFTQNRHLDHKDAIRELKEGVNLVTA
jgi:proteasome-associated ATPase